MSSRKAREARKDLTQSSQFTRISVRQSNSTGVAGIALARLESFESKADGDGCENISSKTQNHIQRSRKSAKKISSLFSAGLFR
jgi:hypothetical protein